MSAIKHIQKSIKLLAILYFISLWIILVLKAFSIVPQKEFVDKIQDYCFFGTPIFILLTLFFTLDKRNGLRRNITWIILTPMFSFSLYILINLLSIFFYQYWVDFSIVYEHKSDSTRTIREQMEDQGAFGYGKRRIVEVDPMLFIFQRVTPVDTNQLEMNEWRYVHREGDVKWP
jgi:hypothetical protein